MHVYIYIYIFTIYIYIYIYTYDISTHRPARRGAARRVLEWPGKQLLYKTNDYQ